MKTVIFLSQCYYQYYDFNLLPELASYRLVALLDPRHGDAVSAPQAAHFAHIYHLPGHPGAVDLVGHSLEKAAVFKAVQQEILLAGGAEHIQLVCDDEFNRVLIGELREHYGIPGVNAEQMAFYRDKHTMKQRLRANNIRVPQSQLLDTEALNDDLAKQYAQFSTQFGSPFIIKPTHGAGGMMTYLVHSLEEFTQAILLAKQNQVTVEINEYIQAKLYHCDSIIADNHVVFAAAAEYLYPNLDFQYGKTFASIPLQENDPLAIRLKAFSADVLAALGPINGSTHMEMFVKDDGDIIFLEVAARPPGTMVTENYDRIYGTHFYNDSLRAQLNLSVQIPNNPVACYSFFGLFPAQRGSIKALIGPTFISTALQVDWTVKVGDNMLHNAQSMMNAIGSFWVQNKNYNELYQDFCSLREQQCIIVE